MEHTRYAARMRYLDASDIDDAVVNYDGLDVYGRDGSKVGNVEGFIVDADARRVNHVVIDSGGWFTSRRLLLPIGHATLAGDRTSLQLDVTKEGLRHLPEYDDDRFARFTDDELRAFERNTLVACCPDEPLEEASATGWGYDSWRHYREPEWWSRARYAPERLRPLRSRTAADRGPAAFTPGAASARDAANRDLVTASEGHDTSPHFGGRAQPGDVLGIETGGERTGVGETTEDENKRRRAAEEAVTEDRED